jgi:adenine-specific DNA-methyltransferase
MESNEEVISSVSSDFGLIWEDQPEAMQKRLASEVPIFKSDLNLGVKSADANEVQHVLIEGDNLHALHTLQTTHRGKVNVIYIDPPYNTGKEFVYNDKLIDLEDSYRHSAWLSFMSKRLKLAKTLLAPGGIILVSIDDNEHSRLRLLMEQTFGERNCMGDLSIVNYWGGRSDRAHFATAHEYLLVFSNDAKLAKIGGFALTPEQIGEYRDEDAIGRFKPETLRKRGAASRREDAPALFYPIYWNEESGVLSLERSSSADKEILPMLDNGNEGRWRWGKDKFIENKDTELLVKITRGRPVVYVKQRLSLEGGEERVSKPKTVWHDPKYNSGAGTRLIKRMVEAEFTNPKPLEYIMDVISMCIPNQVVLDFFAGSGTTLHAVAELNKLDGGTRRCILVTNNENGIATNVTHPRVKAALTGAWLEGQNEALPGALQFYTTEFIERKKNIDRMKTDLARHTVDLVTIKEGVTPLKQVNSDFNVLQGNSLTVAVVTNPDANHKEYESIARNLATEGNELRAYLFTWNDHGVEAELSALWEGWSVEPLPADMLSQLRKLAPDTDDLFKDLNQGGGK